MKVIIVGGTGTIGQAIVTKLCKHHEVITVGNTSGDLQVNIKDPASIEKMYQDAGPVDAVVSAVGKVYFGALKEMTAEHYAIGLQDKLMGQVNLVLIGLKYVNKGGSFTLTSGILSEDPIVFGSSASMVNGAIESFVKAAAIELPNGLRINAVSPTIVTESLAQYEKFFHGFESVSAERVAHAYSKSVDGAQTGRIYRVW